VKEWEGKSEGKMEALRRVSIGRWSSPFRDGIWRKSSQADSGFWMFLQAWRIIWKWQEARG
jgi:hypothetical protein